MEDTQDFLDFKKHFTKYQKQFGLTGYKVYFKHEPLHNAFANITIDHLEMVVTARLNSKNRVANKPFEDVKKSAKHEALHLLVGRLEELAHSRFVNPDQLCEAVEEMVFKLEGLIR